MYKKFEKFSDNYNMLRGVNAFTTTNNIVDVYPSDKDVLESLTTGGQIHKEVRSFLQPYLKPGLKLIDIAELIEKKTEELTNKISNSNPINKGIGFPVGIAINECAAHYHPKPNSTEIINKDDVVKIDFGVEVNEWIIDSAFTFCFNSKYDPLLDAVKDATYYGIKNIGIDVSIPEWGAQIQEVMESYEITLENKIYPIKAIHNLGGHNIVKGLIHGGLFLPAVNMKGYYSSTYRFKEGVYAVETFGSTGANNVSETDESTLYRLNPSHTQLSKANIPDETSLFIDKINNKFKTLPFTDRYIELFNISDYKSKLKLLAKNNFIHSYPPLSVNKGAYTAQYEHTVYIGDNKKIVFSQSDDY